MSDLADLQRHGSAVGIHPHYTDAFGHWHETSVAALQAILGAMGAEEKTDVAPLPASVVAYDDEATVTLALNPAFSHIAHLRWSLLLEDGGTLEDVVESDLTLPGPLAAGYHRLTLFWGPDAAQQHTSHLLVAPRRCFQPQALANGQRRWGISLQLYALRSPRNWGIGDFTDLLTLVRGAARLGAACVGLNPLHALFDAEPEAASPYSPNSRLFLNTLYIDPEAMPEFEDNAATRRLVEADDFRTRLTEARASAHVNYTAVAACKQAVFRLLYRAFQEKLLEAPDSDRARAFRAFQQSRGQTLRDFAVFQALRAHEDYRNGVCPPPDDAANARFAQARAAEVEYHEYLQWEADRQMALVQSTALRLGMTVGLYCDLAVGTNGAGAEAWAHRQFVVDGVSVGAPPDMMNRRGQDWGLPPYNPIRLRDAGYAPLRALLAANMRRGGALRIDHILGFMRLFWIPVGMAPPEGTYVNYPWAELMAVLAIESSRHRCMVIGEDLGTVPPGFSDALSSAGILCTRVFYFERHADGFRPFADYPVDALVTVATHDLPTFAAYWAAADIALRDRLGLFASTNDRDWAIGERNAERGQLAQLLNVPPDAEAPPPTAAMYGALSAVPSKLIMAQLEDMAGQTDQVNLPGTWMEYPNWRTKIPGDIAAVLSSAAVETIANALAPNRADFAPDLGARPVAIPHLPIPATTPTATYRLQFHAGFTFDDAAGLVPYLRTLGISHIYASPWLRSRTGSRHGYDLVDYATIEPELGGALAFDNLHHVASAYGLAQLLDFVPNHMGVGGALNAWWLAMLEGGRASPTAGFFDIEWNLGDEHLRNKVLLPVLGEHYGEALAGNLIRLRFDSSNGRFSAWYHRQRLPIAREHYGRILRFAAAADVESAGALTALAEDFEAAARLRPTRRRARGTELAARLSLAAAESPALNATLHRACEQIGLPADDGSPPALHALLKRQHYALAYWNSAADEINYRRFFNINELAGMRMENPALFKPAHDLVARMIAAGKIHGLRIDHIDGLLDPKLYCQQIGDLGRRLAGDGFYLVVEKVLARHERLRDDWPVHGTTGYDFIAQVSNVLVDGAGEAALDTAYAAFTGIPMDFSAVIAQCKAEAIDTMFRSELRVLARRLHKITQGFWQTRDYTEQGLARALRDIAVHLPVYRTYIDGPEGAGADDRRDLDWALARAEQHWQGTGHYSLSFVVAVISGDFGRANPHLAMAAARFALKFQQFTAPITAKGLEDTAFYRYHRLISLNEVGCDPRQCGGTIAAFHKANLDRAARTPHAMLATATHDTKRGEDTRARIHVLSEMPEAWSQAAGRWAELNARHKTESGGRMTPAANDEYLIYQTLVGAWPVAQSPDLDHLRRRLGEFMTKALREAKQESSWDNPNADYEAGVLKFIDRILDANFGAAFLRHFGAFHDLVARAGLLNSLGQLTLKLTCPGVPDLYQGTEMWDLSLVDPDNRRPVDFRARQAALAVLQQTANLSELLATWRDGHIKAFVTHRLLKLRRDLPDVFLNGSYEPLTVEGPRADHVIAFQRGDAAAGIAVIVGRHFAQLLTEGLLPPAATWGDTVVKMPAIMARDVLTGTLMAKQQSVATAFQALPVAVFAWGPPAST